MRSVRAVGFHHSPGRNTLTHTPHTSTQGSCGNVSLLPSGERAASVHRKGRRKQTSQDDREGIVDILCHKLMGCGGLILFFFFPLSLLSLSMQDVKVNY